MKPVFTEHAPAPIGPYSQAIHRHHTLYCSGQVALDPQTGKLVDGDVSVQAERVLQNLTAVLSAADASLDDVVKTTIYLVDMGDFAAVNAVYATHFGTHRPARSTVAVAALPAGARVEIDAIAHVD